MLVLTITVNLGPAPGLVTGTLSDSRLRVEPRSCLLLRVLPARLAARPPRGLVFSSISSRPRRRAVVSAMRPGRLSWVLRSTPPISSPFLRARCRLVVPPDMQRPAAGSARRTASWRGAAASCAARRRSPPPGEPSQSPFGRTLRLTTPRRALWCSFGRRALVLSDCGAGPMIGLPLTYPLSHPESVRCSSPTNFASHQLGWSTIIRIRRDGHPIDRDCYRCCSTPTACAGGGVLPLAACRAQRAGRCAGRRLSPRRSGRPRRPRHLGLRGNCDEWCSSCPRRPAV